MNNVEILVTDLTRNNPITYYEIGYFDNAGIPGKFFLLVPEISSFYLKHADIIRLELGSNWIAYCKKMLQEGL